MPFTKAKYTLRTEFLDNGEWKPYGFDENFRKNPQITDEQAAFAKLAYIDEWNQYGPPEIRGRTYRLAVYRKRFGLMRLIQIEPIPPARPIDMTNVKWPKADMV